MKKFGYVTSLVPGEVLRVKGASFDDFEFYCHGLVRLSFHVDDGKLVVQIFPYEHES